MALTFPWFTKGKSRSGRVAVSVGPDGLGVAYMNAAGKLQHCQYYDQLGDTEQLLAEVVGQQDWRGVPCSIVLHPVYYQLLLSERPEVEGDELSSAVRWKVKELLQFPLEDAAIAHFLLPDDAYRGRQKMLYAAALPKSVLKSLVEPVEACGLSVDSVEVSELAMNNIIACLPATGGGTALLQLYESEGFINLVDDGAIYLTRRLDFGLSQYEADQDNPRFFDSLFLEIQRSLDFFESQLGKGIITQLYYSPALDRMDKMDNFLSAQLGLNVSKLDLSVLAITDSDVSETMIRCASAIGALIGPSERAEADRAAS